MNHLSIPDSVLAGYSIFAHSRPDKIGTPRLLPPDFYRYLSDYRQKNPLKYYILPIIRHLTIFEE